MAVLNLDGDENGMDIIDAANARAENFREGVLKSGKWRKPEAPKTPGECLWCGASLAPDRRWCDAQCRDDWVMLQRRAQLAGETEDGF